MRGSVEIRTIETQPSNEKYLMSGQELPGVTCLNSTDGDLWQRGGFDLKG